MNRIVRENYPVADLPASLQDGLGSARRVRVIIETPDAPSEPPLSLEQVLAMWEPRNRTMEEIVEEIRRDRDAWDD